MNNTTFLDALRIQGRVLLALSLREIHGKHGKSRLGYLWQLIKTGFGIAVFWGLRELMHAKAPHGMAMPLFLLMGFSIWYIFSEIIRLSMEAVATNRALLTFPQISPLDLVLGSALVAWVTEIVVMFLFLLIFYAAGYSFQLFDPLSLILGMLGIGLFALGLGLILAAFTVYLPALEKLVPMVMRILFFASGVFFSPSQLGGRLGDGLMWNPVLNFIELVRGAFIHPTPADNLKITLIVCITPALLALGLLLERYVRPRLMEL